MRGRLGSQEGVALPVAMASVLVISLFVVAFFTTALHVNDRSVDDRAEKRALAAGEAGLHMALYRLNRIGTNEPTRCLTNAWVPLSDGECPASFPEEVGNESSYKYYVTPEMAQLPAAQRTCVVLPGQTLAGTDRCITVIGTASGVQRRVQARVSTLTGAVSYKSVGLMSKSLMYAGNSSEIKSDVGVNGVAHFGNSAKTYATSAVDGALLRAPGSTYETSGSSQQIAGGQQSVATPFTFLPIDFEAAEIAAQATNLRTLPTPWTAPSGSSYNALTKQFTVTGTPTLEAGTYYFCRFYMDNSAKLQFSTSQPTQIYVDSPSRTGSLCTGQADPSGTFWMRNSNEFNKDGREELVEVFVHGTSFNANRARPSWCTPAGDPPTTDRCESDVLLNNSAGFEGMINAPDTTVELNNSGVFTGAITADKIRFNNSVKFELTAAVKDSAPATSSGVQRDSWIECSVSPSPAGDPESGC